MHVLYHPNEVTGFVSLFSVLNLLEMSISVRDYQSAIIIPCQAKRESEVQYRRITWYKVINMLVAKKHNSSNPIWFWQVSFWIITKTNVTLNIATRKRSLRIKKAYCLPTNCLKILCYKELVGGIVLYIKYALNAWII